MPRTYGSSITVFPGWLEPTNLKWDGSGYRARCTKCPWHDGTRKCGDYVWRVKDRALKHIIEEHERRSGADRRSPP